MELFNSARNFVNAIKSTREFNELILTKNVIERNSTLKSKVYEFNKKRGEIYSSNKSTNVIEAKMTELNREFGSLSKIPEVDNFLKASKVFNEMMFKVYKSMNDSIENDLKFR